MPKIPGNAPIRAPMDNIDPTIVAMAEADVAKRYMPEDVDHNALGELSGLLDDFRQPIVRGRVAPLKGRSLDGDTGSKDDPR